jgi:aspartate-semialdehyde dehydrogenase
MPNNKSGKAIKIAVIGGSGNVGRKATEQLLTRLHINPKCIDLYASPDSAGKLLIIASREFIIRSTEDCNFKSVKIALFGTDAEVSSRYVPRALEAGAFVIDSSSLYRLDAKIPLVVPPVNKNMIDVHKHNLYAIANCIASPVSIVLAALHRLYPIRRISIVSFQSTSGAGKLAMDELKEETSSILSGQEYNRRFFPRQIAFNIIPMIGELLEDGYTQEEIKIITEIRKITSADFAITASCVRVPVLVGHSVSLGIEFENQFDIEKVKQLLSQTPDISFTDKDYATPIEVVDSDKVYVGRIRRDISVSNGLQLWLCSDNLRRGAATDAVEVIEEILRQLCGQSVGKDNT